MKVLITGTSGFIGGQLYTELQEAGYEIEILSRSFVKGIDINKIKGAEVLIHQAAINDTLMSNREEMYRANFYDSIELFKLVVEHGCRKIIYASSASVYGNSSVPYTENSEINPLNVYAESKQLLDSFASDFAYTQGIPVIGLRYSNVYGPGENHKGRRASMVGQLIDKMIKKQKVHLFEFGEQKRDWVYIFDVVRANVHAIRSNACGIYNIGSGEATSFNEIYEIIAEHFDVKERPRYIPNLYKDAFQNYTQCNISLAKKDLGYVPFFDIKTGISRYIDYKKRT